MTPDLQSLGIEQMSVEDRIHLATAIWDTIPEASQRPLLTDAKREELQRRLADHLANPEDVIPWEQVKADGLERFAH